MGIKEKILNQLKKYGHVTKLHVAQSTGSTNAGEYVSRLRSEGHNIECTMATNSKTGKKYGIYTLIASEK